MLQAITAATDAWTERDIEALRDGFVRIRYPDGEPSLEVLMRCDERGCAWNDRDRCHRCGADASIPPGVKAGDPL